MGVAVVCLFLQAFEINVKNVQIGWFGLGCWALAILLPALGLSLNVLLIIVAVLLVITIILLLRRT